MSRTRGIVKEGSGNHALTTTYRILANGKQMEAFMPVEAVTDKTVDVRLAPGATRAIPIVGESADARDSILAAATEWASNRGSKRVWDVDIACALGFQPTQEGCAEFRKAHGLDTPSVPWPNKPEQNPTSGPVVDVNGRPVKGKAA
jgi:hypothetical protein